MQLKATKSLRYRTRRLLPGDTFEASDRDGRLLVAIRKAKPVREATELPPPPPVVAAQIAAAVTPPAQPPRDPLDHDGDGAKGGSTSAGNGDDIKAVRGEYVAVVGKQPFPGWGIDVLREKIEAAKSAS